MEYTIKQLAETSGVSTRTLRFYDKIGLLSPAYYGDNGYRFYGKKELLSLQQILFFRELGFKLDDIKTVIGSDEFDQLESLKKHKAHLAEKIKSLKSLIKTIDKTVSHIGGEIKMKEYELYRGFKHPKQIEMIQYLENNMGESAKKIIEQAKQSTAKMKLSPSDIERLQEEAKNWAQSLKKMLVNNYSTASDEVQKIIELYYQKRIKRFCSPTYQEFVALIETECNHPEYRKKFKELHPNFAAFFLSAVKHYAEIKLKSENSL